MSITMEVSSEEQYIILERRAEKAHEEATRDFQIRSIKVAHEYFQWCCNPDNGFMFPNSGTFVNQFGYEEEDHQIMRAAVERIWKLVFSFQLPKE